MDDLNILNVHIFHENNDEIIYVFFITEPRDDGEIRGTGNEQQSFIKTFR